jgi:hypothetical protein
MEHFRSQYFYMISNCYNICLLKLFKFKIDDKIVLNNDELKETLIKNQEVSKFNEKLKNTVFSLFSIVSLKKISILLIN